MQYIALGLYMDTACVEFFRYKKIISLVDKGRWGGWGLGAILVFKSGILILSIVLVAFTTTKK